MITEVSGEEVYSFLLNIYGRVLPKKMLMLLSIGHKKEVTRG
jgi:hypothetical protein